MHFGLTKCKYLYNDTRVRSVLNNLIVASRIYGSNNRFYIMGSIIWYHSRI